jgi:hypothetical protein
MNPINQIQPVHLRAKGATVATLHAGLLFLIRNQSGISDNDRRTLEQGLASELRDQAYGDWTTKLVSIWQEQLADRFQLTANGDVDQATANALNKLLAELGATDSGPPAQSQYRVYGTIRDNLQRPLVGAAVQAFDKDIRSEQPLGKPVTTDKSGGYTIDYARDQFASTDKDAADVIVRVYDANNKLLKESDTHFNAAHELRVDLDLSERPYSGLSEFEVALAAIRPFVGEVPLSQLTDDAKYRDISFLVSKTGLPQATVEALAMAYRFESDTKIEAAACYGLIRSGPTSHPIVTPAANAAAADFAARRTQTFGALMRQDIDSLMTGLQNAIDSNTIPYEVSDHLPLIRRELEDQQQRYLKQTGGSTAPPELAMKLNIAGLKGEQVSSFVDLFSKLGDANADLWEALRANPKFQAQKTDLLQAVFSLSRLTGEQMVLTDTLITTQKIAKPDDLPALAAHSSEDWLKILNDNKIDPPAGIAGQDNSARAKNYAGVLEQAFTKAFPSTAFAARIRNDRESRIPNAGNVAEFLAGQPKFDLLTSRIGQSVAGKSSKLSPDQAKLVQNLRRTQRVFKLSPSYSATNLLLGDGIDSSQKIYRMGQANFTRKYGPGLGEAEAQRVYQKARQTHAQALTLVGNLKSMSDASYLEVFPNYTTIISAAMQAEVPDLDALFGHTDFCECDECRSVYGAAAYLTDILHFLENRVTSVDCTPSKKASVEEALLRRRPDIADIDLECNNTNTEVPYIDIVNELLEDVIAPPEVMVAATFLPKFVGGTIDPGLRTSIISQLQSSGQPNVAALLSIKAKLSDKYGAERLQDNDTCVVEDHWIIRDQFVVLKATDRGAAGIAVRLLHETLLEADEISANPEYINVKAYDALKTAKRPFSLPFDFFEAEGEAYLEKLGTKKPDLIDAFRREHYPPGPPTPADLDMAYAYLKVNQTERTLIFQPDPANQTGYWGPLASGADAELDLFMIATGLEYEQVLQLLKLKSINPALDSIISSDDLSCDTDKKHVTNLTSKYDTIHRFLRLWKKTGLTLEELDAIVQSPALGGGAIQPPLAWQLHRFLELMKLWTLSAFELLAFYGDIDTGSSDDLYEQLFQNRAATNPLNPDFSIVAVTSGAPIAITDVHRGIISGALGIAPDDLAVLIAGSNGKLTLANLSAFYRMTQLSLALSVSIAELLVLIDLINVPPFADPATTTTFYSKWRTVISSQFAAGELDYILRHRSSATDSLITSDDLIAAALADLQGKLLQTEAATAVKDDPKGELLRKWLADPVLNWNSRLVDRLMEILGTQDDDEYKNRIDASHEFLLNLRIQYHDTMLTADLSALPSGVVLPDSMTTSFAAQISYDDVNRRLVLVGYMSAADQTALIALAPIADPEFSKYKAAVDQLFNAQQTSNAPGNIFFADVSHVDTDLKALLSNQLSDRYKLFLTKIFPLYFPLQQGDVVQKEICSWFKVNKDIAAAMTVSRPAINVSLTDPAFVHKTGPLTAASYGAQFDWYRRMGKICFIVGKLKLTGDDLNWFLAKAASINALDFWGLPVVAVGGPVTTFSPFEVVVNVLGFEQRYPAVKRVTAATTGTVSVYSILDEAIAAASTAIIEADICSLTAWDPVQLDQLINAPTNYLNLALSPSADLKDIRILLRLDRCFAIMKSLGATAGDCVAWSKPSLSFDDALKIKLALKAQTEDDQWLGITQPLQNTLRETRRDMLIAWLLVNPPAGRTWQNADDLYSYFLIDVEMCSCQPTSRIVQATNSVQLLVQRCFLNLEKIVTVDAALDPDWSQWQWMKNFRLWQANRKVFLYPENWIEPELLPAEIKSPFFKDLESDLLQNEVTTASAETAFLKYLDQLEGVSRLEIKAMWYEDGKRTLHVVGRTYGGDPKIYYYRKFVDNRRWTPWIKIDQDVASDHIVLTVFNHRVYLFWAVFTEQSRDVDSVKVPPVPGSSGGTFIPDKPKKYWQIQLAFSEYKNGKWTPKKISNADETGALFVDQSWDGKAYWPDKRIFLFTPLDIPALDPRKYFDSTGKPNNPETLLSDIRTDSISGLQSNGDLRINCYITGDGYMYQGTFDLDPCKGYPIVVYNYQLLFVTLFDHSNFVNMLETEQDNPTDALAVHGAAIVQSTPGTFANLASLQMGFIDRLIYIMNQILYEFAPRSNEMIRRMPVTVGTFMPFFYQDKSYTYFAQPEISDNAGFEFAYQDIEDLLLAVLEGNTNKANEIMARFPKNTPTSLLIHFYNFCHPLVCAFIRILFDKGIDALMARDTQLIGDVIYDRRPDKFDFNKVLQPTNLVYSGQPVTYPLPSGSVTDQHPGYPKADVDFDIKGGYSAYNWELFFHAPLMIAERLSRNQQFEDADHWFRYIFNPTDASRYPAPDKYWETKPFFINVNDKYTQQNIENVMLGINSNIQSLVDDVTDWRNNPFQPHYIAQYRTVAYQKTTVMKYLDHLIAWGDSLFRQDTMESVAEATQIYVLASTILGPKPKIIPPSYELPVDNYGQLQQKLDAFSNALVDIENVLPLQEIVGDTTTQGVGLPSLDTLYFCIPPNDKLMGYWATVGQRLYNIRHCLNIEGKYAPLALFAPPIDPGLLVRAAAAGLDIGSILSDMNAPLPNYRFSVVVQKAVELCNEVKSLGSALLQAMEKKDAEDLALLRSRDGISVLKAALEVRKQQVQEADHNLEALQQQQILVQARIDHFQGLISAGLNSWETSSLNLTQTAIVGEQQAVAIELLVNVLALIPDLEIGGSGFGGTPTVTGQFGGAQLAGAMRALAGAIRGTAGVMHSQAGVSSTQATYERRKEDWQHQVTLAKDEMQQVQKQILAATVRQAIANKEVQNQQLQIDNSQAEDDFMHSKFTNNDLYAWMIGQISTIYFQSFQLASGLAKQAEQTFRYELALGDSSFIQFGYWDSLKKGLLSADRLSYDIRRMDKAYHDQNAREYELTKHISLAQLDASALLLLKTKGQCWINVPEEIYDMDYPGHYLRRIKSVALSIPCVAGPYTSVSCTLTMTKNSMRVGSIGGGANTYPRKKLANGTPTDDPRFRDAVGAIQSIAISSAQNDAGLFELNFRDERYLPFEGAGAISQWHLQLPAPYPQFDYSTISDVIMHVKYTARDGGEQLRADATASLKAKINAMLVSLKDTGLMRAFSARHEFPTEWYTFLNPPAASADQTLTLNMDADRFPYFASMVNIKIRKVELVADTTLSSIPAIQVVPAPGNTSPLNISDAYYAPMLRLVLDYGGKPPGTWTITNPATNPRLASDKVNDLIVIVHYEVS